MNNNIDFNGYEVPINPDNYNNPESIQINPEGALIISAVLMPIFFIGGSLALFGLGSAVKAIGGLSTTEAAIYTAAIVFMAGAVGNYIEPQEDELTSQDAAVIYDSFRFAFDILKSPAEKMIPSAIEEISSSVAEETNLAGGAPEIDTPYGLD